MALAAALLALSAIGLGAEAPAPLEPGTRVRVGVEGRQSTGKLLAVEDEWIRLSTGRDALAIERRRIQWLQVSKRHRSTLSGLETGAAVGMMLATGCLLAGDTCLDIGTRAATFGEGAQVVLGSAIIGAAIGVFLKHDHWFNIELPNRNSAQTLRLLPVVERRGVGIELRVGF